MRTTFIQLAVMIIMVTIGSFVFGQVSKTNSIAGTIISVPLGGAHMDRTFNFTSGDLGGCTSLTEVEISIQLILGNGTPPAPGGYGVHEDLNVRLVSPVGTIVDLVQDRWGYWTGNSSQSHSFNGFNAINGTVNFDDDHLTNIATLNNWPASGDYAPHNALSSFDGENAVGTWTLRISDGNGQFSAMDYVHFVTSTLTVTCGAACTQPDVPTVTASVNPICNGGSTTLNIIGALNDATEWHVYTGFCGVTPVGTTATSSFSVSPTATTTYYIRGEGGCTTPGTCGAVSVTVNGLDDASFNYAAASYCVYDADPTPTITGVPGGTFSSTPGLSLNSGTGAIDVSVSTPGTYTVTYTTNGTCPTSSNTSITVNALDDPSFNYSAASYCVNDSDPTPTVTGLAGGVFTSSAGLSINSGTGLIDVSTSIPGTYTVTYTTTGLCPNSSNVNVTVNALDDASFNYSASSYCASGVDPTPTITGLPGGTFSSSAGLSINASTGVIDVSASSPGVYTVTYTTAGLCPNSSNAGVTINADTDGDGLCDNVDTDDDNDGVIDIMDTNPTNPNQCADADGDSCDDCAVGTDGFGPLPDNLPNNDGADTDGDGICDAGDTDDDNDGVADGSDPAPTNPNICGDANMDGCDDCIVGTDDFGPLPDNIGDATPPTAVCQNINVYLDALGAATIVASDIDGGSTDNCGAVNLSASQTSFSCADLAPNVNNDLIVTGVFDAGLSGGTPKGVELYVVNDIADLSQYGLGSANNGGGTDGEEFTFPAVAATSGQYIYVASEGVQFNNFFGFAPDYTTGVMLVNGDDAVELFHNGAVIDVFGDINIDGTGQAWEYLDGWAYRTSSTGPDSSAFQLGDWTFSGINVFDGETSNATAATPIPIGTFTYASTGSSSISVDLTVTDLSGNSAMCNAIVTVIDTISPVITCPGSQVESLDLTCNFTLPDYTPLVTATDNCTSNLTVTQSPAAGTMVSSTTTITMSVSDDGGNTSTCTFDVVLNDLVAPTAVCQDIVVYLDGAGNATIVAADIDGGSTDNCSGVTLSASNTSFTCADIGPNNVTLTVTDGNMNTDNCVATVTVLDTISPTASCNDLTLHLDGTGMTTIVAGDIDNGSSDNCGVVMTSADVTSFTCANLGPNTVILTVTDGSGNMSTCSSTVTILDTISPIASCQNISLFLDGAGAASMVASDIDNGSADNCSGVTLAADVTSFTCADIGPNTVNLTVTDASGNTSICSSTVFVIDTISPIASCQNITLYLDGAGVASIVASDIDNGSSDNCGGLMLSADMTSFTCANVGANTVNLTADDGSGNVSTCSAIVTVIDSISPLADVMTLADIVATCSVTTLTEPTASDNCSAVTVTNDAVLPITSSSTITWTYTDASGNSSTQTQEVVLNDAVAPIADVAMLTDINGVCEITTLTEPTATDNCSAVTVTNDVILPITSSTTITWTYTDASGNSSTQTQEVVLVDAVPPTASNPDTLYFECISNAVVDVTVVDDEMDNCSNVLTVTHSGDIVSGNGCTDTITRTYNVADASGNDIDVTQIIIVQDLTAPTASNPGSLTVQCIADVPAPVTGWVTDEADNCGTPTVTWVNDVSDGLSCPETISRTFAVTDNCGNSINVVQLIVVMDVDAPVADMAILPTETAFCDVTLTAPTATDNCSGVITATTTQVFPINTLGTTTVTWEYVDDCGNTSSQTQDVVIESIDVSTWIANDGITIVSSNVNAGVTYQWIDCSDNNTAMAGETNHNFTPTYSSDFAVIVTEAGCSDTSDCVTVTEVGLEDLSAIKLTFYPNPTSTGVFNIDYDGQIKSINVIDMIGRQVNLNVNLADGTVDGSTLSDGKYLVKVITMDNQEMLGTIVIRK